MTKHKLYGLGTALVTPFKASGEIDFAALERLIERQISGGVDYLVVLGTTGEAVTLTDSEKQAVKEHVVRQVNKRVPLVLGVGGNNTRRVIEEVRNLKNVHHECPWTAILSVCPYYNKPSQEGLFRHFTAIAEASPIPVILYNVPGRTGVNLQPETVVRIHKACPNAIIGIKEASGNVEQIKHLINLRDSNPQHRLAVISGDDGIAAELMKAGADGLISVASNAFPEAFRTIVHNADTELQQRYANLIRLLFQEGNPSGIKTVLSQQGLICNQLRLPLVPNSKNVQKEIENELCTLS